jgi:hypothetical protein
MCLADDLDDLQRLEAFAAKKAKQPPVLDTNIDGDRGWICVEVGMASDAIVDGSTGKFDAKATRRLHERAIAACTKVLDRDGERGECVAILAGGGVTKVGDHDIFALVGKIPEDPLESAGGMGWSRTSLYGAMKDPRGATAIVEMWNAAIPRAEAKGAGLADWSGWRQRAAEVLGALGGADDKQFLEQQAGATKDKYVEKACRDAAAKIGARLQAPSPAATK